MAAKAHLSQEIRVDRQRGAPRRELRLQTSGVLPDGGEANVVIHNISATGLLLETALELVPGEQIALDLPESGQITAQIMWQSEHLYGCAFAEALSGAALAAAQLQGMPVGEPIPAEAAPVPRTRSGDTLGTRINRLRREAGLTLADVAATLGVSKPTVWAWEKGKARPLPERFDAIAAALGVAPELLADGSGAPHEIEVLVGECRARIAEACGTSVEHVRIMIEL